MVHENLGTRLCLVVTSVQCFVIKIQLIGVSNLQQIIIPVILYVETKQLAVDK